MIHRSVEIEMEEQEERNRKIPACTLTTQEFLRVEKISLKGMEPNPPFDIHSWEKFGHAIRAARTEKQMRSNCHCHCRKEIQNG